MLPSTRRLRKQSFKGIGPGKFVLGAGSSISQIANTSAVRDFGDFRIPPVQRVDREHHCGALAVTGVTLGLDGHGDRRAAAGSPAGDHDNVAFLAVLRVDDVSLAVQKSQANRIDGREARICPASSARQKCLAGLRRGSVFCKSDYTSGSVVKAVIEEVVIEERFEWVNDDYSSILVKALADRLPRPFRSAKACRWPLSNAGSVRR